MRRPAEESFRHLYGNYFAAVQAFFRRFGLEADEARDLAQETFVRLYEHIDEYRGSAEWSYLEVLARNILYNHIRSQNANKRSATVVAFDEVPFLEDAVPSSVDIAFEYDQREQARRLEAAIEQLPPGMKSVIALFLQGHSYDEIARITRLSLDAVKSRIRDAKRALRLALAETRANNIDE